MLPCTRQPCVFPGTWRHRTWRGPGPGRTAFRLHGRAVITEGGRWGDACLGPVHYPPLVPFVLAFGHSLVGSVVCLVRLLRDSCNSVQLTLLHPQGRADLYEVRSFSFSVIVGCF